MWPHVTWDRLWPGLRDVASWGLGAWWGDHLIRSPEAVSDPWQIQLVAVLLGLPLVLRADEARRRDTSQEPQRGAGPPPVNGRHDPDPVETRRRRRGQGV